MITFYEVQLDLMRLRHSVVYTIGVVEALLLARLLLRLLAARPDNSFIAAFLQVTTPLIAPLAFLDAGQPHYGATLDLATLALTLLLACAGAGLVAVHRREHRAR